MSTTDFWHVIENRHSVRRFQEKPVARELIEKILEAGVLAPNAHNRQSWRFVVVTDRAMMERMADSMAPAFREAQLKEGLSAEEVEERVAARKARMCGAPAVVLIFVDTAELNAYSDDNRGSGEYLLAVQSAALAGENMVLAAEALGVSSLWMGGPLFAPENVQETFSLPQSWMAQALLLLGYPETPPSASPRKPMGDIVRWVE